MPGDVAGGRAQAGSTLRTGRRNSWSSSEHDQETTCAGWRRLLPLGVCDLPQGLLRSSTHPIRSMRRIEASSQ
jgi:hypothetical protein